MTHSNWGHRIAADVALNIMVNVFKNLQDHLYIIYIYIILYTYIMICIQYRNYMIYIQCKQRSIFVHQDSMYVDCRI